MDNDLHDIDKLFFDSLGPNEGTPSEKVWDDINKNLDGESRKKPAAFSHWSKRTLILLLFIGLGFGGYQLLHQKKLALQQINVAGTGRNNLQLPLKNDTLKKKNIGNENRTVFEKKAVVKAGVEKELNQDRIRSTDTVTKLVRAIKTTQTTKKTQVVNTRHTSEIANNKTNPGPVNTKFMDTQAAVAKTYNPLMEKKSGNYLKNKQTDIDTNNNPGGNNTINPQNDISVIKKTKEQSITNNNTDFKSNIEIGKTRILYALKATCDVTDISTVRSSVFNLPNLKTFDPALPNLLKNATSKKTAKKKQLLSRSRFYLSAFAAPEWQGYQLKDNGDQPNGSAQNQGGDTKNKIKHREDEDASLVAGIGISYRLSKRLLIESGLRYSGYDIRTDSVKLYAAFNNSTNTVGYKINTSLGYGYLNNTTGTTPVIGDSMVANNLKQSVNYLSLPLLLRYKTGKRRISFNPGLGFVFNFILNSNIRTNLDNGQKQMIHLEGLKKIWVGMMLTPAVYYRFSNRISFGLEPYFNYTISPINKATVVDSYPYGFGLGTVIRYHF